jgi:hypothetical protein
MRARLVLKETDMRIAMGLLLLALLPLPLQANAPSEQDQLAWLNYQLAVAEAPGDHWSDLRMSQMLALMNALAATGPAPSEPMRSYRARAQVVAAELNARVEAARDSDPFLMVADLGCWPKAAQMPVCDLRRAELEPFAADNAYYGVALMAYAWMREDAEAFLRVARLAAGAEVYDSLPALGFQSLVERYRKVPLPPMRGTDALTQAYPAEVLAMALSAGTALPPYQNFSQPCRESEGELRNHCLAIVRKMMLQGEHLLEVGIALEVVEAIGTPDDVALAQARRSELKWLREKALPLLMAMEKVPLSGTEDFFEAYGREGEIAAMRALLAAHGIALLPPAEDASAAPSAKP